MLHSNQEQFQSTIKLTITVSFFLLRNLHPILKNYQGYQILKVSKEFGNFVGRLFNNIQLEADVQNFNAKSQKFLEVKINTKAIIISSSTFHNGERPRKTSEGIVVKNAIGMNTLKNILKDNENESKGNLPI